MAYNVSLGEQLVVGEQHDGPGDVELLGKIAGGWKLIVDAQSSRKNRLTQAAIDLPEERLACSRKWYGKLHAKWLFESTTERAMLDLPESNPGTASFVDHESGEGNEFALEYCGAVFVVQA